MRSNGSNFFFNFGSTFELSLLRSEMPILMLPISLLFQVLGAAVTALLVLGGVHAKPNPDKARGDIQPEAEERQDIIGKKWAHSFVDPNLI